MDKKDVTEALQKLKSSPKRKFSQSIDLIITFKNVDLKKTPVDTQANLQYGTGKKAKVCGLVGPELQEEARKIFDFTVSTVDFDKMDKKAVKKLAKKYDFFVAQSNIMPKIAQVFGRVLGPRQKMPNPKLGCVIAAPQAIKPLYENLQKMVRIVAKTTPHFQCKVGTEGQIEDEVIDNILNVYTQLMHSLPNEEQNIRSVSVKLTMGAPVKL